MADFEPAYKATNERERMVLTNHATDRGGMTFGGISRRHHPDWDGWELVDGGAAAPTHRYHNELLLRHKLLYRQKFWNRMNGKLFTDQEVAEKVYDAFVNCGTAALLWIQMAVNLADREAENELDVDGIIGERTIAAIYRLCRDPRRRWLMLQVFEHYQERRYVDLATRDASQEANLLGWFDHRIQYNTDAPR